MNGHAVVAGASGLIGRHLVQLLLNEPTYSTVTTVVRRPLGITHPKLHEKVVDFDRLEQTDLNFSGADVYCTLGTTIKNAGTQEAFRRVDYDYPLTLGRMVKTQGAKQLLIVTAMGANPSSRIFYNRTKGEIEEALCGLGLGTLQIFRPSLLLGRRIEFRIGERIASITSRILSPMLLGPLRKYRPIQARLVASAMILAAQCNVSGIQVYESDQIARVSAH